MTPAQLAVLTPEERRVLAICEAVPYDVIPHGPQDDGGLYLCFNNNDDTGVGDLYAGPHALPIARMLADCRSAYPAALETIATLRAKIADAHDVVGQLFRVIAERDGLRADLAAANRQIAELAEELYQTRIQRGEAQAERDWAREERDACRAQLAAVLLLGRSDLPPGWSASEDALFERALNADGTAMLYVYLPEDGRCAWEYWVQPRTSVIEHVPGGIFDAIAAAERYAKENL